jgi:DNA-binding CsgD family transcriptional regulator
MGPLRSLTPIVWEAATIDSRAMHEALSRLYGAVVAPAEWSAAWENVTDLLQADHAIVYGAESGGRYPAVLSVRLDPRDVARYCTPEAARLGSPMLRRMPLGVVISRSDIMRDSEWEATAFYNEIIRPADGYHSVNARFHVLGDETPFVNFCRSRRAGPFCAAGKATLQAMLPHFAAAFDLMHRFQAVRRQNDSVLCLLDQLDSGVILVGAAAEPCFVNRRAALILAEADGLTLGPAGLLAATPNATRRLRRAVADLRPVDDGRPQSGLAAGQPIRLTLPRPSQRPPLLLSLHPIWRLGGAAPSIPRPLVGIFVSEPDVCPPLDRDALADTFRLTPREAAVADLLASGQDLKGAAQALAIGIGTARNHLKHEFEKTDTHSQATLMARLRGFVRRRS